MQKHRSKIGQNFLKVVPVLIFIFLFSNISFACINLSSSSFENNFALFHNDDLFLFSSAHHPDEIPEAPDEAPINNNEKSSEKESEDDRDDELFGFDFTQLLQVKTVRTITFFHFQSELSASEKIPFYILFHSWKSFLL
jgi:hypothetical protein